MKTLGASIRILIAALVAASLCGLGGSAAGAAATLGRLQPVLRQMASQTPDQRVSVIVQKAGAGQSAEAQTAKLGGTVTDDLRIINAFAAEMTPEPPRSWRPMPRCAG